MPLYLLRQRSPAMVHLPRWQTAGFPARSYQRPAKGEYWRATSPLSLRTEVVILPSVNGVNHSDRGGDGALYEQRCSPTGWPSR